MPDNDETVNDAQATGQDGPADTGQDRPDVQTGDEAQDSGQDGPDASEVPAVADNGDVSDPGNSGGFGSAGQVGGNAEKPNG
jgi:hypothetical protein